MLNFVIHLTHRPHFLTFFYISPVFFTGNANKLYMNMLADVVIGKMFGELGRTILRMLFQGLVLCVGIIVEVATGAFISVTAGFIMMIVVIFLLTLVGAIGASFAFERMEALD